MALDGQYELVCGAFSSDAARSQSFGQMLHLHPERCYANYAELLKTEALLPAAERIDAVVIVTPNHLHYPIAKAAMESGFHVICDKPATMTLAQALTLKSIIDQTKRCYCLTHTYTGYPMIKQARHLIASGDIGEVVKVVAEYSQGWLASQDDERSKQASWRLDPKQSGISSCMADIGVHAAQLAMYVTGLSISHICADLNTVVSGRQLDDDGTVLLKFDTGAKGVLLASQIAIGDENNLKLRIYGSKKSLEWSQLDPNSLVVKSNTTTTETYRTGAQNICDAAKLATRTPAGHPEGYIEAFANLYMNFAKQILAHNTPQFQCNEAFDVPGITDAINGMAFIENVVAASQSNTKWQPFNLTGQTVEGEHHDAI